MDAWLSRVKIKCNWCNKEKHVLTITKGWLFVSSIRLCLDCMLSLVKYFNGSEQSLTSKKESERDE